MKIFTTLVFVTFTIFAFSQEETKKISFSPFVQTGVSYQKINKEIYSRYENPAGAQGAGITISYQINKLKVQSGIQYQKYAIINRYEGLTFGDQIDHQNGFTNTNSQLFNAVSFKYLHQYITVPIGVSYPAITFGQSSSINLAVGVASNFHIKSKVIAKKHKDGKSFDKKTENYKFDARKISLSSYYAITYERQLKKIVLFVGPKFDLFHNPNTNNTPIKRTPYKVSLLLGVTF